MNRKAFYIVLGVILFLLVGSSIYTNFICNNPTIVNYILLAQILLGVITSIFTLYVGSNILTNKKSYKIMLISLLEVIFVLLLVTLNVVYGYKNVINANVYNEYMEYVSMYTNIYIYGLFAFILGLLTLNSFITYKVKN